jgi:hypothetical protein
LSLNLSQCSAGLSTLPSCAISSIWRISLARASWDLTCSTCFSLQACKLFAAPCNFISRDLKGHVADSIEFHAARTISQYPETPQAWSRRIQSGNAFFPDLLITETLLLDFPELWSAKTGTHYYYHNRCSYNNTKFRT